MPDSAAALEPGEPLLVMRGITKAFPGVQALRSVDLELHRGEVLALLGENGAGKSTLIKVLGGAHAPDAGDIRIDGKSADTATPIAARGSGIAVIYQEFNLLRSMTVRENLFLGREPTRLGFVSAREETRMAEDVFRRMGVRIDPETPARELSVAQQQVVEIAKALLLDARILVMDEPTATLSQQEVEKLFGVIRDLKRHGLGIIYISHRLDEVFAIADRVMVLRDGARVACSRIAEATRERLIEHMVGRKIESEFPARERRVGATRLRVRDLCRGRKVRGVSFDLRRGEVLGLTGLVGAGRTETARAIFGADRADSGSVTLDGKPLRLSRPRDAIRSGICLLTEDRKSQGLVLGRSVRENFALASLRALSRAGFIRAAAERASLSRYVGALRIKVRDTESPVRNLSGGNQQKVLLARWLETGSEVVIFDEPTRGVDVGAKYEIYLLINELVERGKSILLISSELPEIIGMCDRVIVMREGRIAGEIADAASATQESILELALG